MNSEFIEQFKIFENIAPGIIIHSDGKINYLNSSAREILNDIDNTLIGKPVLEILDDNLKNLSRYRIEKLLKGEKVNIIEGVINTIDKEPKEVMISSSLYTVNDKNYIIAAITDISSQKDEEEAKRKREERLKYLDEISRVETQDEKSLINYIIEEAVALTDSKIGFFHFINEDQNTLRLFTWSKDTLKHCAAVQEGHYPIEAAGIWVESFRQGRPVIYNDYENSENKKGVPKGHIELTRFMSLPIVEGGIYYAIAGVGNKEEEYNEEDMRRLSIFLNSMWLQVKKMRIENRLKESEEKYRALVEKSNNGIIIVQDKQIIFANQKMTDLFGYSNQELIGMNFSRLYAGDSIIKAITIYNSRIDGEEPPNRYEINARTKFGKILPVEQNASLIEINEQPAVIVFITDISERKKREFEITKLSRAVQYAPVSIVMTDTSGNIEFVNKRFEDVSGYKTNEVIGKAISILKSGLVEKSVYIDLWDTIKKGEIWEGELINKKKSGELFWEEVHIFSIKDSDRNIINYLSIQEDITQRKRKEEELLHTNKNLRLLNECHIALINCESEKEMLFAFCDIAINIIGFDMSVIGDYVNDKQSKEISFFSVASSSSLDIETETLKKYSNINIVPNCFIHKAIESNSLQICLYNEGCGNCINRELQNDFNSIIAVPFFEEYQGSKKILLLYRIANTEVDDLTIHLIYELMNYINFGFGILKEKREKKEFQDMHLIEKQQLGVTLNSIADAVLSLNANGRITYINKAAEKLFERSEKELLGKLVFDEIVLLTESDEPIIFNPFDLINISKEDAKNKYKLYVSETKKKYITISVNKLTMPSGDYLGLVIVMKDISKIVQIELQAALSQKMESVGLLAAGISHEINTPMQFVGDNTFFLKESFTSILDFANEAYELVNNSSIDENTKKILKNLYKEKDIEYYKVEVPIAIDRTIDGIDRVRKIVKAMKNFSHSSGKMKAQANINQGIEVTVTISKNEWKYNADLKLELDRNMPLVYCSLDEINQVLLNMIINASQAIAEKKTKDRKFQGEILIKTFFDKDNAYMSVTDNGAGIPKDKIDRVFDPFFTTKEVGKGTGQGLAIAHSIIVKHHRGTIEVVSEKNIGTTFTIGLPFK